MWIFFYFVNLAAASPWLRRSWSPNYSVLVPILILLRTIHFVLAFINWGRDRDNFFVRFAELLLKIAFVKSTEVGIIFVSLQ
jgi:hypothetical protein